MNLSLISLFSDLEDPRQVHKVHHSLEDIIVLSILAVISNAQSWTDIASFGEAKADWLKQYLNLDNGIPSHDTIQRVFQSLNPDELMKRFVRWTQEVMSATEGRLIAIDGKSLRGSYDKFKNQEALHLVRAWATEQGLILGHQRVGEKRNEITAIPEVLNLLALKGCIVTLDAMGCQTAIASQIQTQGGDYILALKANQPRLYEHTQEWFEAAHASQFRDMPDHDYAQTIHKGHGRIEIRECWIMRNTPLAQDFREREGWTGLHTLIQVRRQREVNGLRTQETHYYISSLQQEDAATILQAIRRHWAIENECHWVLDVIFDEDRSRIRLGDAPENFAILRQIALSILKQDKSKGSLKAKRFKAALNDDFRLLLLQNLHA